MSTRLAWTKASARTFLQPLRALLDGSANLDLFSHLLVGSSCLAISLFLLCRYVRPWSRRDVPYQSIISTLAAFLMICGVSSLLYGIEAGTGRPPIAAVSLAMAVAACSSVTALALMVRRAGPPCDPRHFEREIADRQRAEEALCKNEVIARRLALAASRIKSAVMVTDAQARIEWVNEGFTRLTGYTLADAQGHHPGEFVEGTDSDPGLPAALNERMRRAGVPG